MNTLHNYHEEDRLRQIPDRSKTLSDFADELAAKTQGRVLHLCPAGATVQTHDRQEISLPGPEGGARWRSKCRTIIDQTRSYAEWLYRDAQAGWRDVLVAAGLGRERPMRFCGRDWIYCWNPAKNTHVWYCFQTDTSHPQPDVTT